MYKVRPRGRGGGVCVLGGHGDGVAVYLWPVVCFVCLVVLFCLVCGDVTVKEM